jgi:hypothetical protein
VGLEFVAAGMLVVVILRDIRRSRRRRAAPECLEINLAKILTFIRKYRGVGMEGFSDGHAPILLLAVQPGRFFGTRCWDTPVRYQRRSLRHASEWQRSNQGKAWSALRGIASSFNCPAPPQPTRHLNFGAMNKVVQSPFRVASSEMIAKLIRAGYLQPARRHDADAITQAIAKMKQDLRGGRIDDDGPNAAWPVWRVVFGVLGDR